MLVAILLVVFPFCMAFAGVTDTLSMKIANRVPLVLLGTFVVVAPLTGMPMVDVGWHLLAGLIALVPVFAFFAYGTMGAGDAKLIVATVTWMGFGMASIDYMIALSIFGGALAVGMIIFRGTRLHSLIGHNMFLKNFSIENQQSKGIPYGVALGAAGLMTYPSSPLGMWALQQLAG